MFNMIHLFWRLPEKTNFVLVPWFHTVRTTISSQINCNPFFLESSAPTYWNGSSKKRNHLNDTTYVSGSLYRTNKYLDCLKTTIDGFIGFLEIWHFSSNKKLCCFYLPLVSSSLWSLGKSHFMTHETYVCLTYWHVSVILSPTKHAIIPKITHTLSGP